MTKLLFITVLSAVFAGCAFVFGFWKMIGALVAFILAIGFLMTVFS